MSSTQARRIGFWRGVGRTLKAYRRELRWSLEQRRKNREAAKLPGADVRRWQ